MNASCYWCGSQAVSDDHVPARCFFPPEMKSGLVTVPSCEKHNTELSKIDERFRHYVQGCSESAIAEKEFAGPTIRSLQRPEAKGYLDSLVKAMKPAVLDGNLTIAQSLTDEHFQLFCEKLGRGLFFHHVKTQFQGTIKCESSHLVKKGRDFRDTLSAFKEVIPLLAEVGVPHPEIFAYRFGHAVEAEGMGFVVFATFYGDVSFLICGTPTVSSKNSLLQT